MKKANKRTEHLKQSEGFETTKPLLRSIALPRPIPQKGAD